MEDGSKTREQLVDELVDLRGRISELQREVDSTREKPSGLYEFLLDSIPHPAMLIHSDKTVLAANRIARQVGARVGGLCWRDFGQSEYISDSDKQYLNMHKGAIPPDGIKCTFCLAEVTMSTKSPIHVPDVEAFGKIWDTWWIPVTEDTYFHYAIDISDKKPAEGTGTARVPGSYLPICACCKKIRDKQGTWHEMAAYFLEHSEVKFTHGFCTGCYEDMLREMEQEKK